MGFNPGREGLYFLFEDVSDRPDLLPDFDEDFEPDAFDALRFEPLALFFADDDFATVFDPPLDLLDDEDFLTEDFFAEAFFAPVDLEEVVVPPDFFAPDFFAPAFDELFEPVELFESFAAEDFEAGDFAPPFDDDFDPPDFDDRFDEVLEDPEAGGTLPPASRASERPIAMACLRLVTFCPEPLFNVPLFISCMTASTFSCDF